MIPSAPPRKRSNSARVNLLISAVFHGVILLALAYFAAREGLLGKELKKIAVEMVRPEPKPEEPEPEKPREELAEKAPEPEAAPETPATPPPQLAAPSTPAPPPAGANPSAAPPPVAPPSLDLPSFAFEGGRAVRTVSDPVELYRSLIEHSLRSRWDRPQDVADRYFVAEVDLAVDRTGRISDPQWKKRSGHAKWDASVQTALQATTAVTRPPPTNFPSRVLVRFDVQEVVDELPATP